MFCASPQRGREPAPLRCHPTSPLSSANGTAAEADGILDACAFGLSPAEVDDILFWCARSPSKILLHSDESSSEVPPDEGWASSMSTADLSPLREALQTVLLSSHHVLGSGASSPASAAAQSMSGQASTLGSGPSTAGTTMMGSTRKAILRPPSLSSPNGFTGLADPIDVTNSTAATFLEHIRRSAPYLPEARVPSSPTGYSFGRAGEAYNPWDSPDSSCIPYLRLNQTWSVLSVVPPPRSFVGWSSSNRRRPPVSRLVSDRLDAIFPAWHALTRWSTVATSACAKMPAQGSPSSATSRTLSDRCTPWQSFGVFPRHLGVGSAMVTASQWYQHVHQEVGSGGPLTSVDASMETQRDATCGRDGSSSTVFWKVRAEVHVGLSQGSQLGTCAGSTEDGSPLQRHVRLFDAIRHFEESGTMHERVVWCLLNDGLVRLLTSSPVLDSVPTCPPHEDEAANATPTSPPMYFTAKWPRSDDAEDKNVLHNHREHALCEPVGLYVETHPSTNGDTGLQLRLTVVAQTRHRAVDGRRGMSAADDRTESQATIVEAAEDDEAAIAHAALSMVFPQEFIFSTHTTAVAVCPVTSGWGPGSPGPGHGWIPVSVASARTGRCMRYEPPSGISHQGTSISREDVDLPESGTDDDEVEVDVDELHAALTSAVMDLMAELESLKSFALLVQGSFYGTSVEPPLPPASDGGEVEPAEYLSFVSATELASLLQCRLGVSSLRGWPFLRAHYDLLRHEDTLRLVGHESSTLPTPGAVHSEATLLAARIGLSDGLVRAQRQVHEVHAQVDQWIQQQVLQPLQTHENYLKRRANGARKMCATSAPFYGLPTLRLALQCCTNLQAQRIGVRGGTKASKALHASGPIRFVGPQARQQQADLAEGVDRLTAHMLDLCRIVRDEHLRMRQLLIVWRTLFAPHLVGVLRVMMEERAAREKLEAAFLPPSSHEPSTTLVRLTATSRAASSSEGDSSCAAIVVGRPSKRRPKVRHGPQRPEDVPFLVYRTKVGLTLCALAFVLSSVLILLLTGSSADAPQGWA